MPAFRDHRGRERKSERSAAKSTLLLAEKMQEKEGKKKGEDFGNPAGLIQFSLWSSNRQLFKEKAVEANSASPQWSSY